MSRSRSTLRAPRFSVAVAAVSTVLATAACGGGGDEYEPGETIELTLGAGHPAGGAITYANYSQSFLVPELEKRVAEETDYTLEIDEQYGGSVATLDEVLESTQSGVIDIGLVPYPFEPANLPLLNVTYYVPFGSPDPAQVLSAANYMADENPEILEELENTWNQKQLAFVMTGDYGLGTTFPVTSMKDVEGQKLAGAGPNLEWISAVGGVPVQGNLNEWYTGIQTGVYNGAVIFIDAYAGFKLHEVAPNFTKVEFGAMLTGGVHMNLDAYNGLPEEVRTILEEVAQEYEDTFADAVAADEQKTLDTLTAAGITPAEFPEAERAKWAESLPNMPQQKADEGNDAGLPGTKAVKDYIKGLEDAGYTMPRDWKVE